jgi:hypothetical protein
VGLDQDAASLDLARRQDPDGRTGLIRGDFLTHPFTPGLSRFQSRVHHLYR